MPMSPMKYILATMSKLLSHGDFARKEVDGLVPTRFLRMAADGVWWPVLNRKLMPLRGPKAVLWRFHLMYTPK
ncbi:hypothetical protein HZH68_005490 [Vespula germanica]|uniref:Uncharacterized protein n=1 Tax=Vespula germanica TaxID=30212 RepID=A0A834KHT0_VESGE|nr:hypothetical protein HZH68_005490 [Vespula germanica]